MQRLVQQGTTVIIPFETLDASENRVAPDNPPTVSAVHVEGVPNAALTTAATVTQRQDSTPANITGYYQVSFSSATLATNDDVDVTINATISGVDKVFVKSALIINLAGGQPVIR